MVVVDAPLRDGIAVFSCSWSSSTRGSSRPSRSSTPFGRASSRASATSGSSSPSGRGGSASSRRSLRVSARMPALASQVSERDIVRAGFDPATLTPAEVYAAKLVLAVAILGIGVRPDAAFRFALILALPLAFIGYVFPTEYLGSLGRRRKAQLLA